MVPRLITPQFRKSVERNLSRKIKQGFLNQSPEVASLQFGQLRGEFGLTAAERKVDRILSTISKQIEVDVKFFPRKTRLRFTLFRQQSYANLLTLPEANQQATATGRGRSSSNTVLPWLSWLLFSGSNVVVRDANLQIGVRNNAIGRSGLPFLMNSFADDITGYRVNPLYQGTASNNFITRQFERMRQDLTGTLREQRNKLIQNARRRLL